MKQPKIIKWEQVNINPMIATEMLKKNNVNRKLGECISSKYAKDMIDGNWQLLPSSMAISINEEGVLLDGQHRLKALIKANKEIPFLVFTLSEAKNAQECMFDQQKKRTDADVLGVRPGDCKRIKALINFCYGQESKHFSIPKIKTLIESCDKEKLNILLKLPAHQRASSCNNTLPVSALLGAYIYILQNPFTSYEDVREALHDCMRKNTSHPIAVKIRSSIVTPECVWWLKSNDLPEKKVNTFNRTLEFYNIFMRNENKLNKQCMKYLDRKVYGDNLRNFLKKELGWE